MKLTQHIALAWFSAAVATAATKPNVVVILADDQGWGDLSLHGNQDLATPNIDRLAEEGAHFQHFYVQPVCSPTRAEFLTGRYATRSGVVSTSEGGERMALTEKTIGDCFKAAGYRTACFGKWHNGSQWPYHPNARGFDEFYGFASGHWANYFDPELEHNGEIVRGKGFIIDDLTTRAMAFMEASGEKPFFAYLAYNTPHSPMQVPDQYWDRFKAKPLTMLPNKAKDLHSRAALAMCENIDWNVGRILKKLKALDKDKDTIIIYFSDNGPNGWRWNGEMKGIKGSTDEGGVRSPMMIRWPETIRPKQQISPIAGAIDLLPTLTDLAGINRVGDLALDGISLKPLLLGNKTAWPDRTLINHWQNRTSVRSQQYRLDHNGQLYDLFNDPSQTHPVQAHHPELAAQLAKIAANHRNTAIGPNAKGLPFAIGHRERPLATLPARDGVGHGAIQRSNKHPNSSYFCEWKDDKAHITWDVEAATAGTYEITLYYACAAEHAGCSITLTAGEAQTSQAINKVHDPALIGPDDDRSPRMESPTKRFMPIPIGQIQLAQGRQTLTLSASDLRGGEAIEVQRLQLRLIK